MKFLFVATLVTLTALAAAENCKRGFAYCGWDLMNIGNYHDTIVEQLNYAEVPADANHIYNDLYFCKDKMGGIYRLRSCSGDYTCNYGGYMRNDYCS